MEHVMPSKWWEYASQYVVDKLGKPDKICQSMSVMLAITRRRGLEAIPIDVGSAPCFDEGRAGPDGSLKLMGFWEICENGLGDAVRGWVSKSASSH